MARQMLLHSQTTILGISRRLVQPRLRAMGGVLAPGLLRCVEFNSKLCWREMARNRERAGHKVGRWSAAPCAPAISKNQSGETI